MWCGVLYEVYLCVVWCVLYEVYLLYLGGVCWLHRGTGQVVRGYRHRLAQREVSVM